MKNTTTTYSIRWTSWRCSHFDETHATVKKYMAIMTTRRHAEISDLSPKKFPLPYPKISATPQRPWLAWAAALRQPLGHFCVSATPTKNATSIEPCLVIRNTGHHEAHGLGIFVASLRQFWKKRWKTSDQSKTRKMSSASSWTSE